MYGSELAPLKYVDRGRQKFDRKIKLIVLFQTFYTQSAASIESFANEPRPLGDFNAEAAAVAVGPKLIKYTNLEVDAINSGHVQLAYRLRLHPPLRLVMLLMGNHCKNVIEHHSLSGPYLKKNFLGGLKIKSYTFS